MPKGFIKLLLFIVFFYMLQGISAENFPASAVDGKGRKVILNSKPQHIISLGASSTEILFALDAQKQIAAVSEVSDFPQEAKLLPKTGGFDGKTLSLEKLLAFQPDFVILFAGMHDFLIPSLEKYKIPFYVSDVKNVEEVVQEIVNLGVLTGNSAKGEQLKENYSQQLSEFNKKTEHHPSLYYEVWASPFMSIGKNSFINSIIEISGAENVFSEINQAYPVVSEENIIALNPEFILIPQSSNLTKQNIASRHGWSTIKAVQENKIFFVNDDIFSRPGPRVFEAIKELQEILYEK